MFVMAESNAQSFTFNMETIPFSRLHGDLQRLVRQLDHAVVVEVRALSPLPIEASPRRSYRLTFQNGRVLKGRVFLDAATAERAITLYHYLPGDHVPRIISHTGVAMLSAWADGNDVPVLAGDCEQASQFGRLHALIHQAAIPASLMEMYMRGLDEDIDALFDGLDYIRRHAGWDRHVTAELAAMARRHIPKDVNVVLIHGDFCAENAVVDGHRRVVLIDNEWINIGHQAYDLATTWYRWPMTKAERIAYLEAYQEIGDLSMFANHFRFWLMRALVKSALVRMKGNNPQSRVPLNALLALRDSGAAGRSYNEPKDLL